MKTQYAKISKALLLILTVALSACGSDNPADQNGGMGVGVNTGGVSVGPSGVQADGSQVVSFSGTGQLTSTGRLLAGQFMATTGNLGSDGTYAYFQNAIGGRTSEDLFILGHSWGALSLGTVAAYGSTMQKQERFYYSRDGRTNISVSVGTYNGSGIPLSGVITLSPEYMARELGGRQIVGVGIDLSTWSNILGGQAFLLTGPNNGSFIVF